MAICVDRSLEMVAGLMGILKAGAAYVPLDPDYPIDRLTYMLENCAPAVVLTQEALRAVLPASSVPVLLLDPEHAEREGFPYPTGYQSVAGRGPSRASGLCDLHLRFDWPAERRDERTPWRGQPSAVDADEYGLDASDSVLQKTPFSFDVSVWEFFWPLFNGGAAGDGASGWSS